MKKKILAIMLSAVLAAVMLAGCGDNVETSGKAEVSDSAPIAETASSAVDNKTETEDSSQGETDKENETIQTLDLETCGNLVSLMEAAAASVYGNSLRSMGSAVINAADAQEWVNQLYQGSWENIGDILCELCSMNVWSEHTPDISYINEIMSQPEAVEISNQLYNGYGCEWMFNKEQMEHVADSITGGTWEMQDLDSVSDSKASNTLTNTERYEDKVLLYFWADGDNNKLSLENMALERIDAVNWKVTADGFVYGIWLSPTKIAEFTFTVTYNADSCFDGYSITGIEVAPIDNSGWAQAYLDQMNKETQPKTYDLIYLDDDDIPELVSELESWCIVSMYTWNDGQLHTVIDEWSYGAWGNVGYEYNEYTGIVWYRETRGGGVTVFSNYEKVDENYDWKTIHVFRTDYYIDTNENGWIDDDDEYLEEGIDYIWDAASDSYQQITGEEYHEAYDAMGVSAESWKSLTGKYDSDTMRSVLESFLN